eukprot:TRINITY_DN680_c0_g1_i2.p1 TRINITY_DN680_c0_g1~~TRINITY_DN680_c0_g1_i2.p1  ORF type:complete len:576 (-),score=148.04 TRINITY_DN680_c0_g1_i2:78-1805(-)
MNVVSCKTCGEKVPLEKLNEHAYVFGCALEETAEETVVVSKKEEKRKPKHTWESANMLQPTKCFLPSCGGLIGMSGLKCKSCISTVHSGCSAQYDAFVSCEAGKHQFIPKTFGYVVHCSHCEKVLWGFSQQGKLCIHCRGVVHHECEALIDPLCFEGKWKKEVPPYKCDNCYHGRCENQKLRDNLHKVLEQNPELLNQTPELLKGTLSVADVVDETIGHLKQSTRNIQREEVEEASQQKQRQEGEEKEMQNANTNLEQKVKEDEPSTPQPEEETSAMNSWFKSLVSKITTADSEVSEKAPSEALSEALSEASEAPGETKEEEEEKEKEKEEKEKENFGCSNPVSCTCECNVGSTHDVLQKAFAITGGLGLFAGSIAATILTAGAATPLIAAAVGISSGLIGGVGFSSAIHGGAAAINKTKINGRDFGLDVGIGAVTGVLSGGIGVGLATGVGVVAATTGHAINAAGNAGVSVAGGIVSGASGTLVADGIEISAGRKDQTELGENLGINVLTAGAMGAVSVASDASKHLHGFAAEMAYKSTQAVVQETLSVTAKTSLGKVKQRRRERDKRLQNKRQ